MTKKDQHPMDDSSTILETQTAEISPSELPDSAVAIQPSNDGELDTQYPPSTNQPKPITCKPAQSSKKGYPIAVKKQVIRMVNDGVSKNEIHRQLGVSRPTINAWCHNAPNIQAAPDTPIDDALTSVPAHTPRQFDAPTIRHLWFSALQRKKWSIEKHIDKLIQMTECLTTKAIGGKGVTVDDNASQLRALDILGDVFARAGMIAAPPVDASEASASAAAMVRLVQYDASGREQVLEIGIKSGS